MVDPFVGSEALARGALNRHQLRSRYRALYPNVYLPKEIQPSFAQRVIGAWLWSDRQATIAGAAAAALYGVGWIDDVPVELIHCNARAPRGVLTRRAVLLDGEVRVLAGRAVTTPTRTAFDIGRRGPVRSAVAKLDALARVTDFKVADVVRVAMRHRGVRGLRQLETTLGLLDSGAQSPQESYLRLLLIEAGLPRPQTQIPVVTDDGMCYLDLGWEKYMVAVEYDGDHHRSDRRQYLKDIRRLEMLERMGWLIVRVVAEDHPADVMRRVRRALQARKSSVC
jgi:very-short-patch-repair endonuclease